jgi:hypothetical protein
VSAKHRENVQTEKGKLGKIRRLFQAGYVQAIENAAKLHVTQQSGKMPPNTLITYQNLALCSVLRYVCRLSGPKGHPITFSPKKTPRDRAFDPVAECPRHGGQIALALALTLLATPALSDDWQHGSSFDRKVQPSSWKRSTFEETSFVIKPALAPVTPAVKKAQTPKQPFRLDPALTPIGNLRNLISSAESGRLDYDAVAYGAPVPPPQLPTLLLVGQNQNHAIGRYQFIPATFERLASQTKIPDVALFTRDLQDRWANILILEAGYPKFVAGALAPDTFMDNVALIWAGLPLASGKSAYEDLNGNHATLARNSYSQNIALIFPAQAAYFTSHQTFANATTAAQ